ncbi:MAG: hypothetical protein HY951_04695 [Bacteroidia bacterium]|nr:hypothetical protein [Bacteroidia bacterium]
MNTNISIIEFLTEFAEQTKRKIYASETEYPGPNINTETFHKRILFMPENSSEQSFLIGYHDSKSFNENELYFGVFFPISISNSIKISIRKKDIIDKLNPLLKQKIFKTENDDFDSQTIITGNDKSIVDKYFHNNYTQILILDCLNIKHGINVGINGFNLDFVPAFKNKSHFGIYTRLAWIRDTKIIEDLFKKIEQFRKIIIDK